MRFHPDVLASHAQFGGDLEDMQRRYDAAPAPEKAAPIPADVLAMARETVAQVHEAEGGHHAAFRVREGYMDNRAPMLVALRLLADRASQEERIREDERDSPANLAKRVLSMREHLRHERADGADLGTLSVVARTLARLRGGAS